MTENFRLLMIGAMYENGGNTSHRFWMGTHNYLCIHLNHSQALNMLMTI